MTPNIEDIRRDQSGISLLDEIRSGLRPQDGGEKRLPTLLLYDKRGLKLFEDITYLDQYYLTNAEIQLLESHATDIAALIPHESDILELGSGNLRKVQILLDALELAHKRVNYFALDLSKPELERTLAAVPKHYRFVHCQGLWGTYDDGLEWLKRPEKQRRPKWILSLGSSLGNFGREEAAAFLQDFADTLRSSDDGILVGLDACQDKRKIFNAYNDRHGKTHEFVMNGLVHANRLLTKDVFKLGDWQVIGEYDESAGRHQAFYSPKKDLVIDGVYVEAGEKIRIEESHKYSSAQSSTLWQTIVGLLQRASYGNSNDDYRKITSPSASNANQSVIVCHVLRYLHVLGKRTLAFPLKPEEYAVEPVPTWPEFQASWSAWDAVTNMIQEDELLSQPIRDVDNPALCHAHSERPDSWPPMNEILDYQAKVRARVKALLSERDEGIHRDRVGRALWLGFEHEAMHLETLLYMILQSDKALPPPGPVPNFEVIRQKARQTAVDNEWIQIPASTILVGTDDPGDNDGSTGYFGWDNEKPAQEKIVPAFEAKARPLTNEDFARYLDETNQNALPASWTQQTTATNGNGTTATIGNGTTATNGNGTTAANGNLESLNSHSEPSSFAVFLEGKSVRTVYGPVALRHALGWPVSASYDELAGCAQWMNGRIPNVDEVRSIYNQVDAAKKKQAEKAQAKLTGVNGHLSNDGVEESPPSAPALNGSSGVSDCPTPHDLFVNLEDCNVGFSNFHPTPVTHLGKQLCGRGELGGVWEWTSSTLEEHDGFVAMAEYPGYTADFLDGKHNM
ncbi:MAG: hypothetical protein Q9168_006300 [Polycauliona sp. 1 TL-2023]